MYTNCVILACATRSFAIGSLLLVRSRLAAATRSSASHGLLHAMPTIFDTFGAFIIFILSLSLSDSLAVVCGCLHHLREIDKHVLDIENSIKLIFICISLGVIAVLCLCKCVYEAATVDSYYYLPLRRRRHPSDRSISQQKKYLSANNNNTKNGHD